MELFVHDQRPGPGVGDRRVERVPEDGELQQAIHVGLGLGLAGELGEQRQAGGLVDHTPLLGAFPLLDNQRTGLSLGTPTARLGCLRVGFGNVRVLPGRSWPRRRSGRVILRVVLYGRYGAFDHGRWVLLRFQPAHARAAVSQRARGLALGDVGELSTQRDAVALPRRAAGLRDVDGMAFDHSGNFSRLGSGGPNSSMPLRPGSCRWGPTVSGS